MLLAESHQVAKVLKNIVSQRLILSTYLRRTSISLGNNETIINLKFESSF